MLGARGDHGYDAGGRVAHLNHAEPHLAAVFAYLGVTEAHTIAIERDEFADAGLERSREAAEDAVDRLAAALAADSDARSAAA